MPRSVRVKSGSGIYHIMWRGANRQEIFHDNEDCITFLEILMKYKVKAQMKVFAWCLMNNHVHLLLKEGNEDISITMKRIGVSFVSNYNSKYKTTGHLFQDRFRSENVETRRYLLTVVRYIHQNPVKAGIARSAEGWRWSSCAEYYGNKSYPSGLLDSQYILKLFSADPSISLDLFKQFNETNSDDQCLDEEESKGRLPDNEARVLIKELLDDVEVAQVKGLPRSRRNEVLRRVKRIKGISQRQAARILGVSPNLIFKA